MNPGGDDLVQRIRAGLRELAQPDRAPQMQAYMKSAMPFLGVPVPQVRRLVSQLVKDLQQHGQVPPEVLTAAAAHLWRTASHREERYAATSLTGSKILKGDLALLGLHQEMIVTGAWWDHVDEISHRIGDLLHAHPDALRPVVLRWSTDPDRWLRRTSIICQLRHRVDTDLDLLTAVIAPNTADRDFFIRKAIGWALRDYAWTDPVWVSTFVGQHRESLSPLTIREAMKNIG